jgi:hypothetical protein
MFTHPDRIGQLAREHHLQMLAQARQRQPRPECDVDVRLTAEDRDPVSRKGNIPVRSEN